MAISLILGYIEKPINSLKDIMDHPLKTYWSVKLKKPCSIKNPVWIVNDAPAFKDHNKINYAYFGDYKYWVDDIISLNNRHWQITAHLDVLATYKTSILNNVALVAYSNRANGKMFTDDMRFNPEFEQKDDARTIKTNFGLKVNGTSTSQAVVLQVMDTVAEGIRFWAMDWTNFGKVVASLNGSAIGAAAAAIRGDASAGDILTEVGQDIMGLLGSFGGSSSWRDNFISATGTMIDISHYGQLTTGTIYVGGIPVNNITCKELDGNALIMEGSALRIPLNWTDEQDLIDFLKLPRWCTYQVITPSGYQEIDTTHLIDQDEIWAKAAVDLTNGEWTIRLYEDNTGNTLGIYSGCWGIDLMKFIGTGENVGTWMGNMASNVASTAAKFVGSMAGVGVGAAQQNVNLAQSVNDSMGGGYDWMVQSAQANKDKVFATSALSSIGSGIIGSVAPNSVRIGSAVGAISSNATSITVMPKVDDDGNLALLQITRTNYLPNIMRGPNGVSILPYVDFCDKYGYCCNSWIPLNAITGYCRTAGASLVIPGATPAEIGEINSMLNSGVYIPAH